MGVAFLDYPPNRAFISIIFYAFLSTLVLNFSVLASTTPLNSANCMGCHESQTQAWEKSDHAMSMALPSTDTVRANFDNQRAIYETQAALFFIQEGQYKATITDTTNNISETFIIQYTFGHYPLQQYLVATKLGTYQVLPFAWDARPTQEGGQRWYHNYAGEKISTQDRLHWRQPLQNWNGMCADCHSDEVKRNYDPVTNSFNTQLSGINVGCVSCHGVMDNHIDEGKAHVLESSLLPLKHGLHNPMTYSSLNTSGVWTLKDDADTAVYQGPERDNTFMQTCYACHSLRAPLSDGFSAQGAFLDQFSPSLVAPPLYHADGQIKEEVFVYGSFLQSKMYAKGVNCLDCHDPHTMKVKIQGNGLCLQCHKAVEFDTPKHHKHTAFTPGAQCVNCHMTNETYMGVDKRRDHSFKRPAPHLSDTFETPNACTSCHEDKDDSWAAKAIQLWYGKPVAISSTQQNLLRLRHNQVITLAEHLAIVNDGSIDVISRASALGLMPQTTAVLSARQLAPFVAHDEDLIRLAAARIGALVDVNERVLVLSVLLDDKFKSVRTAAAQALITLPIANNNMAIFTKAFNELTTANENSAWRGEGRLNQGNNAMQYGDQISAEMAFKASIEIDPYFPVGYINLSDLYRTKQREDLVAHVLTKGLDAVPESADVVYAYGLHLVRSRNIQDAVTQFKRAMHLNPQKVQLAYTYALALDGNNQTVLAISELKRIIGQYPNKQTLVELGHHFARKINSKTDFDWFTQASKK